MFYKKSKMLRHIKDTLLFSAFTLYDVHYDNVCNICVY